MARKIEIEFDEKTYVIEYNRESVVKLMSSQNDDESDVEKAVNIIYYGLYKHHKYNMPDKDIIYGWVMALGKDLETFVKELTTCIEEVLTVIKSEQKSGNLKWGVVQK